MTLADTIPYMTSGDTKERLKAEYWQLKIRIEKLRGIMESWRITETYSMLLEQRIYMEHYLGSLERRAKRDGVNLEEPI